MPVAKGVAFTLRVCLKTPSDNLIGVAPTTYLLSKDGAAYAALASQPAADPGYGCVLALTATEANAGVLKVLLLHEAIAPFEAVIQTETATASADQANRVAPDNAAIAAIAAKLPVTTVASKEDVGAITIVISDGPGAKRLDYRVLMDSNGDGVPDAPNVGIAGVTCILTSDRAGDTRVGSPKITDTQGNVTWRGLAPGTYYVWREHPRFRFTDPDTEVVA